jgi:hypothetical protein
MKPIITAPAEDRKRNWELKPGKETFPDISSTNIDAFVPSLYQCVETLNY